MRECFVDSTVLVFALGGEHRWQAPSRRILEAAVARRVRLHVNVEAWQETTFHRLRMSPRAEALADAEDLMAATVPHAFDAAVWDRALHLMRTTSIRGRDAVHAATALEHGFTEIVTTDSDFYDVPGLTAVTPDRLDLV